MEYYTKVPTKLVDEMCNRRFSSLQSNVLWTIIRHTYGYERDAHKMSTGYISIKVGKNISEVGRAIRKLIADNVIVCKGKQKNVRVIGINENYSEWKTLSNIRSEQDNKIPSECTVCKADCTDEIDISAMSVDEMLNI